MGIVYNDNGILKTVDRVTQGANGYIKRMDIVTYNNNGVMATILESVDYINSARFVATRQDYSWAGEPWSTVTGVSTITVNNNVIAINSSSNQCAFYNSTIELCDSNGNTVTSKLPPWIDVEMSFSLYISGSGWSNTFSYYPLDTVDLPNISYPYSRTDVRKFSSITWLTNKYWSSGTLQFGGCVQSGSQYITCTINYIKILDSRTNTVLKTVPLTITLT